MLKKLLFQIAKAPFMGTIVGRAFQHCSWAIPVKKVYSSKEIIAFYHPRPSYENHIILSPKRAVKNLQQLSPESFVQIWEAAKAICAAHPEYNDSFVLIANGGKRQEVQQMHFHMFTGQEIVNESSGQSDPDWEIHFVIRPDSPSQMGNVLHSIDQLNAEFNIVQKGYSLVYQYNKQKSNQEYPAFHIVAGKKLN